MQAVVTVAQNGIEMESGRMTGIEMFADARGLLVVVAAHLVDILLTNASGTERPTQGQCRALQREATGGGSPCHRPQQICRIVTGPETGWTLVRGHPIIERQWVGGFATTCR